LGNIKKEVKEITADLLTAIRFFGHILHGSLAFKYEFYVLSYWISMK
jgi:hypothetical protein